MRFAILNAGAQLMLSTENDHNTHSTFSFVCCLAKKKKTANIEDEH